MFKRSQKAVSENAKNWYQDKYQHVLTQRNMLALIAVIALFAATIAVLIVMRMAPLKSVEPYLIEMDEKTGITQRVVPTSRKEYAANPAVDRYFTSLYLRAREGYNINILRPNHDTVRLMSTPGIYYTFSNEVSTENATGYVKRLGALGMRTIRIRSMAYIDNPAQKGEAVDKPKIMQVRFTATESVPNLSQKEVFLIATITFEYANLDLNQDEQLLNPLGYTVTSYQIQSEIE